MVEVGVWDLGQRFMAAAWESAASLMGEHPEGAGGFLESLATLEAQLAGLRLHVLGQVRQDAVAGRVLDEFIGNTRLGHQQARAQVRLAADLSERFVLVGDALGSGLISVSQADAIVDGLRKLPSRLDRGQLRLCQTEILGWVEELGPNELRVLAARTFELIDPAGAEEEERKRLGREEQRARRTRFFRLSLDHQGSITLRGKVPVVDGVLLRAQLDALLPSLASYEDTEERLPAREIRMADALMRLVEMAAAGGELPMQGGDRPHVIINLALTSLIDGLGSVQLPGLPEGLTAGEARRLACDANLIPIVLGEVSEPLDQGRSKRLVEGSLRHTLTVRDRGCVFPGCDAHPATCDAHHIRPWHAGGATSLANIVLLCPRHHRLVEPDPGLGDKMQWRVHLDPDTGLPWFTPPTHIDPNRRPRLHQRHVLARASLAPPGEATRPPEPVNGSNKEPTAPPKSNTFINSWGFEQERPDPNGWRWTAE